jgi:PadR family transcriptional regulator, regulatory protein AphA
VKKESRTRYAVLGMLSLGDMSGYEIKKHVEQSIVHFWSESYGQIYPELTRLSAEGLAVLKPQRSRQGRARKTYGLTRKGFSELQQWLRAPVREEPPRSELLLKLFFGNCAPPDANMEHVKEFRAQHAQLLKVYDGISRQLKAARPNDPGLPYWLITLSFGRHRARALVSWADETLAVLEATENGRRAGKEKLRWKSKQ